MRFVPYKRSLPHSFARHPKAKGLLAEADIRPHRHGRLAAKLLVFTTAAALRRFWKSAISEYELGRGCCGAVNGLMVQVEDHRKGKEPVPVELRGDARYFCVIGLCQGSLGTEVIVHEAIHAGFCYEKRVGRNLFGTPAADFDEERICYPAGAIAAGINRFLHDRNLYPE